MGRWRNLPQMKEQEKAMARDLSEADISDMLDGVFKMIIRIHIGLRKE